MIKKMKTLLSSVLVGILMFNLCVPAFAANNNHISGMVLYDEFGNSYYLAMSDNEDSRSGILYDGDGNVVLSMEVDVESATIQNAVTKESITFSLAGPERLTPCKVLSSRGNNYEYEFCSLGQEKYDSDTITVGEIENMVGAVVNVATISAVIIMMVGGIPFVEAARNGIALLADSVLDLILMGVSNHEITITVKSVCTELYENDPFHPQGGFYFLGYYPDATYFDYDI